MTACEAPNEVTPHVTPHVAEAVVKAREAPTPHVAPYLPAQIERVLRAAEAGPRSKVTRSRHPREPARRIGSPPSRSRRIGGGNHLSPSAGYLHYRANTPAATPTVWHFEES